MSLIKAENFISGLNECENDDDFKGLDSKKILGKVLFSKWRKKCKILVFFLLTQILKK
jgi:hypothetical protein